MADGNWLIWLILVGLAIWGIAASVDWLRRRALWRKIAAELGLEFSPKDPFNTPARQKKAFFQQGQDRRAYNVMYGEHNGVRVRCFDYKYWDSAGRYDTVLYFTCLLVALPIRFCPLSVRAEGPADRLGHLLGIHDLQFESVEFNRQFAVCCTSKRFAYDVIHPRMMELMLQHKHRAIEAYGWSVLIYDPGGQARTSELEGEVKRLLEYGLGFVELLPRYLQAGSR